jgi:hypothetical protein
MKRLTVILPLVALASPAIAANTPEALVRELTQAAYNGDEKAFVANLTGDTQRAMAEVDATSSKLVEAKKNFQAALDERFGNSPPGGGQQPGIVDRKTVLSRLVNIELIGVEQKTPTEAELRLKTISKGSGDQTVTEEDTLPAVKEGDEWKLELADLTRRIIQGLDKGVTAYAQVAAEVRSGAFKDRLSAVLAVLKAQRSEAGREE